MKYVLIFLAIVGLVAILVKLILFILFKIKASKGYPVFIKLVKYNPFNWLQLGGGVASIIAGIIFYKIYELDYILLIWGVIALFQLVNTFISPKNCLVMDSRGLRRDYTGKLLKWGFIKSININKAANYQMIILYGKKNYIIDCDNRQTLDVVAHGVQKVREDIYEKFFAGV
jgi:hypothetical protein